MGRIIKNNTGRLCMKKCSAKPLYLVRCSQFDQNIDMSTEEMGQFYKYPKTNIKEDEPTPKHGSSNPII